MRTIEQWGSRKEELRVSVQVPGGTTLTENVIVWVANNPDRIVAISPEALVIHVHAAFAMQDKLDPMVIMEVNAIRIPTWRSIITYR